MNRPISPLQLSVLIHCYTSPTKHPNYSNVRYTLKDFLCADIIQHDKGESEIFITTAKGDAWMKAILATPMPTQAWIDSNGKVISHD